MNITARAYLTAGIAALSASAFGINFDGFGSVGINLGGLLNVTPVDTPITQYNGGIAIDALGGPVTDDTNVSFLGAQTIWGVPVGLGGSVVHMGQFLGEKLKVTPPAPGAAVAAAAAVAEAPAPAVKAAAPALADATAPAVKAAAPALPDAPDLVVEAPAVADAPAAPVKASARQSNSAPTARHQAAASDNGDSAGSGRAHRGKMAQG